MAVVWDFFGVISSEVAPFWFAAHFPPDQALALKAQVVGAADRGEIGEEELFTDLGRRAGCSAADIRRSWHDLAKIDAEVVDLVAESRRLGKVGLLTNSPGPFVRNLLTVHGLDRLFDAVVVSSEARVAKPNPRAYQLMIAALDVSPGTAVMIDDNPQNVAGAREAGLQAHQFVSVASCRLALGL